MSAPDLLPVCTTREVRGRIQIRGHAAVPLYCMNCHKQHGYRNEPEAGSGYVGYLCDDCAEKWSPVVGLMLVPDEAFAARANEEMMESFGRILTTREQTDQLADGNSSLAKLVRSR